MWDCDDQGITDLAVQEEEASRPLVMTDSKAGLHSEYVDCAVLCVLALNRHMLATPRADTRKPSGAEEATKPSKLLLMDGPVHTGNAVPLNT